MKKATNNESRQWACNQVNERNGVFRFMDRQIRELKASNRLRTAENYQQARNSLFQFLGGREISFRSLNEPLVEAYSNYLVQRGLLRNTISFYMRIWRALYNKAVAQHLARRYHPFHHVYTGIDHTQKRAVSERTIIRLKALKLPEGSDLEFARDLFIFSYCTRGMSFVDIAYLRKSEVRSGMIRYTRKKTRQPLLICVEGPIRQLVEKYSKRPNTSPYLFPILPGEDPKSDYTHYRAALNRHNRLLQKLSEMLPGKKPLSSYTARHSWASVARNLQIPLSVISAGLGHTSERTTEIYLSSLDHSVVDSANQRLLKRLK